MKTFLVALQFLTVLPVRIDAEINDRDFGRSLLWFPAVGLFIGLLLSSAAAGLFSFLPDAAAGALLLLTSVVITGGLHLEGLADTCDGLLTGAPKEEILKIMRDSRAGVMAVIGVASFMLVKFALIISIPRGNVWKALIMMSVFARWSQALACCTCGYARKDGKAKFFIENARGNDIAAGGFFVFVLFFLTSGFKGVAIFFSSCLLIFLFINYVKKKIGGMTGDTLGATNEIAEVLILFSNVF